MTERELFLAAIDIPEPAARAAYLEKACAGNPALRGKVEGLLRSHEAAGSFLVNPAVAPPAADHAGTRAFTPTPDPDAEATGASDSGPLADADESLAFLAPPGRADSLGRVGHYEVLQVLGRGGFGIVFRAFDEVLQRVVAMKVLAPQMAATSPARRRFLREARSSAQVRHENVVQVYEVGENPLPHLVMEFIPGETLQQRLDRTGPLEVAEVLRIGRQVAEGLAAAHATDLIHRDIKPGNVLLEGGHQKVKITDFGLARAADDASISQSGVVIGTPMFMAPEQAKGEHIDHRADLFSLGSVLYQMVTGRPPFRSSSTMGVLKRVAEHAPRPIREIIPETPQWLCDIIAKLHEKHPDNRFQSAREVADVLADCEARLNAKARTADFPRIPREKVEKAGWWKWAAAAAVLLSLAAFGVYTLTRPTRPPDAGGAGTASPPLPAPGDPRSPWHGWPADAPAPAVAPFDAAAAKAHQQAWAKYLGVPVEYANTIGMKFVLIPPGEFLMGSTPEEIEEALRSGEVGPGVLQDRVRSEGPRHPVILTQPLYLGIHEVTQGQYGRVMGVNPSHFASGGAGSGAVAGLSTSAFPVEMVSWDDAVAFCDKLGQKENLVAPAGPAERAGGAAYRLPTEAEWEYGCRAGTTTTFWFGSEEAGLARVGWFGGNAGGRPHAVGELQANPFGLHDTHGNVWEWVQDWSNLTHYRSRSGKPVTNPAGPLTSPSNERGLRGGMYSAAVFRCRCAYRDVNVPPQKSSDVGFRVVLSVDAVKQTIGGLLPAKGNSGPIAPLPDADAKRIAALPATEQIEEVRKELKKRNPDFDGILTPTIENDVVTGLEVITANVTDISPVRALTGLRVLVCRGLEGNGKLADLSPLRGMQLVSLDCNNTQVADLAPLKGMPLTVLYCQHTRVSELSPLTEMPLEHVNCSHTAVADLSPLKGMKLVTLFLDDTKVTDLSPLAGMPLRFLNVRNVKLQPDRDGAILRGLDRLEDVNSESAAGFLKKLDGK